MLKIGRFYAFLIFFGVVGNLLLFFVLSRNDDHKPTVDVGDHRIEKKYDDVGELERLLKRQDDRKQKITDVCKGLTRNVTLLTDSYSINLLKLSFTPIFVDDRYKLLYCSIPKVACTNWKRILLILTEKMNTSDPKELKRYEVHRRFQETYLKTLDDYSGDEIQYRLKNYYKFIFVREPFERLLSAYRDKFTLKADTDVLFNDQFGRRIVKFYRNSPSNWSLEHGDDVTFGEFLRYILDPNTRIGRPFNAHWEQYHRLCHPCLIRYDLVGKYETLKEDVDLALSQMGIGGLVKFPDSETREEKTADILAREYANVGLSDADVHRLFHIYSTDFSLFGYKYPSFMTDRNQTTLKRKSI